jgi:hypothetical protein
VTVGLTSGLTSVTTICSTVGERPRINAEHAIRQIAEQVRELDDIDHYNAQAIANMAVIGLTQSNFKLGESHSIADFLLKSADYYRSLATMKNGDFLFYSWVDAMAGQLRMSAISSLFQQPPFGCECNFSASPHDIESHCLVVLEVLPDHARDSLDVWVHRLNA